MEYVTILLIAFIGMIGSFIFGSRHGQNKIATTMVNKFDFGDVVIDMSSVDKPLISADFNRNPKEMLGLNYILLNVKIRE